MPKAQNNLAATLFRNTLSNRVPGVPLFTKDLNCHCIDPNKDFVLNPAQNNALATQKVSPTGVTPQGFGQIDPNQVQAGTPRTGQLVLRIGF